MTSADPYAEAADAAKALFKDLLKHGVPWEARMDASLGVYRRHLTTSGIIPTPSQAPAETDHPPTDDELNDTAHWLSDQSGSPRYRDGDGWILLRTNVDDINFAYEKARDRIHPQERHLYQALRLARKVLLNNVVDTIETR